MVQLDQTKRCAGSARVGEDVDDWPRPPDEKNCPVSRLIGVTAPLVPTAGAEVRRRHYGVAAVVDAFADPLAVAMRGHGTLIGRENRVRAGNGQRGAASRSEVGS